MTRTEPDSTSRPSAPRTGPLQSARRVRGLTILTATAAAVALWMVVDPLAGIELEASSGGSIRQVGPIAVMFAGVAAGVAGWALLALLERVSSNARAIWTIAASVVLALSLLGTGSAVTTAATVGLVSLHLLVGGILIAGLRHSALQPVEVGG